MTANHGAGTLTCPRCGETIEGAFVDTGIGTDDDTVRVPFDCPECDAPLEIVVETTTSDTDVWIEDRREE